MSSRRPSPARATMTRPSTSSRRAPASWVTPRSAVSSAGAGAAPATPQRACSGPPDPSSGCGRERSAHSSHRSPSLASTSNSPSVRSPWPGSGARSRRAMSIWWRRLAANPSSPRSGLTRVFRISAVAWDCDKRLSPTRGSDPLRFFPIPSIPLSPARLPGCLRLSEHPERDRPRERLWSVGPAALTGQELVAILLGTGYAGRDALAVAGEVLARVEGSLRRLAGRPSADLARVPGVGRGKAARVAAALELGRRVGAEEEPPPERIRGPADVQRFYASRLRDLAVEEFHVLALGSQSQVLGDLLITRGILNSSLVHPREVFRAAIAEAAAGIIVVHNHPSGDATPSADDRAVTRQLVDAGRLLDVPVYDHVIVGGDRYVSFAEAGLL